MAWYVSDGDGAGGRLRARPEDFRVRELEAFDVDVRPVDADPGSYPHLVVRATLRDRDTNGFAGDLADALGVSRERVSWAGTKDKRAVTTQLFSVRGVAAGDLPEVAGAELSVLGRAGRPVLFGDLAGNAFEVTVREPERPGAVPAVTDELRAFGGSGAGGGGDGESGEVRVGVPNYFGQQRFGSLRPVTHAVGLAVVRGDFEAAVLTYLGEASEHEPEGTRAAREFVAETRDWQAALERFPGHLGYERAMLHRLAEGGSFREALETLPANLQQLLVNAAQSHAFNLMLSARLERGLPFDEPVAGDVVCFAERDGHADVTVPDADRTQRVTADRLDAVARHVERGRAFVTAPLVGTETELGEGEPGEVEREVLDELGVAPADFDLPGEFGSTGTRRAVLVTTDCEVERDAGEDALRFGFALPKGSYATVLLREYLKLAPHEMA